MATVGSLLIRLGIDGKGFSSGLNNSLRSLNRVSASLRNSGAKLSAALTVPLVGIGFQAIRTTKDFQASMNRIQALTQATSQEFSGLSEQAKELGRTTQFTAVQTAEAMGFLAQAGFDANEILGATPGTLQLAASAQLDFASAADIVTNVLTGYGLEVEQLARVNDVLVKTFTSANTDLVQLGEAMKFVGPVASTMGVSLEEAASAIALLGNAGLQASVAGTGLRNILTRLVNPSSAADKALNRLGVRALSAEGRLRKLPEIIQEFERAAERMGGTVNISADLIEIFGQRGGPAFAALLSQGSGALESFIEELQNAGGIAEKVAEAQLKGLPGALLKAQSALEGVSLTIGQLLAPFIEKAARLIVRMTQAFQNLQPQTKAFLVFAGAGAAALGPLLIGLSLAITLISPWSLLAVAILSVGAAGLVIARNWETIGPQLERVWQSIFKELGINFSDFNNTLVQIGQAISGNLKSLLGQDVWDLISQNWELGLAALVTVVTLRLGAIRLLFVGFSTLLKGGLIAGAIGFIAKQWNLDFQDVRNAASTFINFMSTTFLDGLRSALGAASEFIGRLLSTPEASASVSFDASGLEALTNLPDLSASSKNVADGLSQIQQALANINSESRAISLIGSDLKLLESILVDQIQNMNEFKDLATLAISGMADQIENEFIRMARESIDAVDELTRGVIKLLEALDNEVVGNSIIPDMIDASVAQFDRLNSEAVPIVRTAVAAMETELIQAEPAIGSFAEEMQRLNEIVQQTDEFKAMADLYRQLQGVMKESKNEAKQFQAAVGNIPKTINSALTETVAATEDSVSFMDVLFRNFKFNSQTVFEDIRNAAVFTWGSIQTQFVASLAGMIQGTATFADFMKQLWNTVLQAALNTIISIGVQWALAQATQTAASSAALTAQVVADQARLASTTSTEAARAGVIALANAAIIKSAFVAVSSATVIADATLGILKTVLLGVVAFLLAVAKAVSPAPIVGQVLAGGLIVAAASTAFIGGAAITAALGAVQTVAGTALTTLGTLATATTIPALAEGALVTGPTIAQIGEGNEFEAVLPLSKLDGMLGAREQTTIIEIDGRRLTEFVVRHMPKVVRAKIGAGL